jgi:hypothetical protein
MENYANPNGATAAWVIGGVVVAGGLLYLALKPKAPAAETSSGNTIPLSIVTTPLTPTVPVTISPTPITTPPDLCQPVSKVDAFAASVGKKPYYGESQITAPAIQGVLAYVHTQCSFYTWDGTEWAKDDAMNAKFADWLVKLQAQLQDSPSATFMV